MKCLTKLVATTVIAIAIPVSCFGGAVERKPSQGDKIRILITQANHEKEALLRELRKPEQFRPKSKIGRMLLAAKLAESEQPGWEKFILDTLPSSDSEMEAFLEFTSAPENKGFEPL